MRSTCKQNSTPHHPYNLMERANIAYIKCALRLIKCSCAPKLTIYLLFMFNGSFYMWLPLLSNCLNKLKTILELPFNLWRYSYRHLSFRCLYQYSIPQSATANCSSHFSSPWHHHRWVLYYLWHYVIISRQISHWNSDSFTVKWAILFNYNHLLSSALNPAPFLV